MILWIMCSVRVLTYVNSDIQSGLIIVLTRHVNQDCESWTWTHKCNVHASKTYRIWLERCQRGHHTWGSCSLPATSISTSGWSLRCFWLVMDSLRSKWLCGASCATTWQTHKLLLGFLFLFIHLQALTTRIQRWRSITTGTCSKKNHVGWWMECLCKWKSKCTLLTMAGNWTAMQTLL